MPDKNVTRTPDLLDRNFTAPAPNQRWLTHSTPDPARPSAGRLPPKRSASSHSCFNNPALQRPIESGQFTSVASAETLTLEGIAASIGSIGDACDNALVESTIGPFKNEAIRTNSPSRGGPLRRLDDVEWITMDRVDWYNQRRLPSRLGNAPPEEFESTYYAGLNMSPQPAMTSA